MWQVTGRLQDGSSVPLVFQERSGQIVSAEIVRALTAEVRTRADEATARAFDHVEAELQHARFWEIQALPEVEGLDLWAAQAARMFVPSRREAQDALVAGPDGSLIWEVGGRRRAAAWHDRTVCVVLVPPGVHTLDFTYLPDREDAARSRSLGRLVPDEQPAESVDCRVYLGSRTLVGTMRTWLRNGRAALKLGAHEGGVLLARIAGCVPILTSTAREDPSRASRLAAQTLKFPGIARASFDLRSTQPPKGPNCIVLIHGTGACGIELLRRIVTGTPAIAPNRVYRYEHDTFLAIEDNADELASLLSKSECPELLLLAHSRGGLVARRAAQILSARGFAKPMEIWTYGTPYDGTPMVNAAKKLPAVFLLLGAVSHGDLPLLDPATAGMAYMLAQCRTLPLGLEAMAPQHHVLKAINNNADPYRIRSYGGRFAGSVGFLSGFDQGIFGTDEHDTVVPLKSALFVGAPTQVAASCAHGEFFAHQDVRIPIAGFP